MTAAAITTALFTSYTPGASFAFLATIYLCGWRLHSVNARPGIKIMLLLIAIAVLSPLLLWSSTPESREFNQRIGYGWGGSYFYPYFALLPIPILAFTWKCFLPPQTLVRYVLGSLVECFVLIPANILLIVGV